MLLCGVNIISAAYLVSKYKLSCCDSGCLAVVSVEKKGKKKNKNSGLIDNSYIILFLVLKEIIKP